MMWLFWAFAAAFLLGFYDASKKYALKDNAVIPVLFLSTVFSTIIFSPAIVNNLVSGSYAPVIPVYKAHILVLFKSFIVLISWIFGYFGLKHLPITIVGPINATRPVLVLLGAMLIFGERLNCYQWIGVLLAIISIFMLSLSGKKEKIDFIHNKWIIFVGISSVVGAACGLYDKYIMQILPTIFVQSWYNFYQMLIMAIVMVFIWYPTRKHTTKFHWSWAILLISVFISLSDYAYLSALSAEDSMVSIVSTVKRAAVIVSFICGIVVFKEKNIKSKALDLCLLLISMVFIWLGSR